MGRWKVRYVNGNGDEEERTITASERWTKHGMVTFLDRKVTGSTMQVTEVWSIPVERIRQAEAE